MPNLSNATLRRVEIWLARLGEFFFLLLALGCELGALASYVYVFQSVHLMASAPGVPLGAAIASYVFFRLGQLAYRIASVLGSQYYKLRHADDYSF